MKINFISIQKVFPNAKFVVNGFERFDLDQGIMGDCWFIAGCAGIIQSPTCFAKVVPHDQGFGDDYAGKRRFVNQ